MEPNLLDMEAAPDTAAGRAGHSLLQILWRRKALVLLGLVVGLILGSLYYAQKLPVYQSSAQVLVIKKRADALPIPGSDAGWSYMDDYLATHMKLIQSPLIVGQAAKKKEVQTLATLAGRPDATGIILGGLGVSRDKGSYGSPSNILELSFRGPVAEDCGIILNAVIQSYRDFLDETYRNVSDDTLKLITKARDSLHKDLVAKEKEYSHFREQNPSLWKGKDGTTSQQDRYISVEARITALQLRRAEVRERLRTLEQAVQAGRSRAELIALIRPAEKKPKEETKDLHNLEDQLVALLLQQQQLREDYGKDHPQVLAVTRRIAFIEKILGQGGPVQGGQKKVAATVDPVEAHLKTLREELDDIEISYRGLAELQKGQLDEARERSRYEIQDEAFRNDIGRITRLYDSIIKRLEEINVVRDFGGYDARTISPPGVGGKVAPRLVQFLAGGGVLGLLLGLGLAYLADVADKSFRTPDEIRRRLGLPVVGHIWHLTPHRDAIQGGDGNLPVLDPMLCTYYRSKSVEAEAYRGVRTALYFSTSGQGHQVIQITSPGMGDGKTTLAANLAVSIAQSGKRVILLDADFRRPRLHKVFGLTGGVGLASVIIGEAGLSEAVRDTVVANLAVLPCGPIPPNPAEVLTSARFKEVLDALRADYDFVIIDTPPLLAVTDPCVVAPRVDGVYLALRLTKNGRPQAERAKEILTTLGAKVLGVVVNDIAKKAGGGGYDYAHYQYGYGPGYSDPYSEEDGEGSVPSSPGE
jgi:capsular exopolysaccharide synthesis family protein